MRKPILAIAAAASVFTLTAAGAAATATTGSVTGGEKISTGTLESAITLTAACADTFNIEFFYLLGELVKVTARNTNEGTPSAACTDAGVTASLTVGAETFDANGTYVDLTKTWTFTGVPTTLTTGSNAVVITFTEK